MNASTYFFVLISLRPKVTCALKTVSTFVMGVYEIGSVKCVRKVYQFGVLRCYCRLRRNIDVSVYN